MIDSRFRELTIPPRQSPTLHVILGSPSLSEVQTFSR
jgi:hypothetical protein